MSSNEPDKSNEPDQSNQPDKSNGPEESNGPDPSSGPGHSTPPSDALCFPLHFQEWGAGDPVLALHPLALESTAFAGVAQQLARHGLRTLAVDLPGFGRTPGPDAPLTPARMAEPVIEMARRLEKRPLLMGMSMGGRVALEAALCAPEAFRGVTLIAPYLPWRSKRMMLQLARWMNPSAAERVPLERAWPLLKATVNLVERRPNIREDWLARAAVRVAYYFTCPATRVHFLSAARELALDRAFGPEGLWTRLRDMQIPAAFVWGGRDRLIPASHAESVATVMPRAHHFRVACSGHFANGRHFRCLEHAMESALLRVREEAGGDEPVPQRPRPLLDAPCLVGPPLGDALAELPARP